MDIQMQACIKTVCSQNSNIHERARQKRNPETGNDQGRQENIHKKATVQGQNPREQYKVTK